MSRVTVRGLVAVVSGRPMLTRRYRYELRHGGKTIATGHLTRPQPLQIGDQIEINGSLGIVRELEPLLGERELRLVLELMRTSSPDRPS